MTAAIRQPIAIIGLGLRLPGAEALSDFWNILAGGKSQIRELPRNRWSRDEAAQSGVWGGFIDDADRFDADFFSISPREAAWMDPQQRFALEMAWHAIEDAGYAASALAGSRTGVFMGVCHWDYAELLEKRLSYLDAYTPTGIAFSIIANRVSHFFDFKGPSVVNDTACAASLTAVHDAVSALQAGECDMALAGGVNLIWSPNHFTAFAKAGMLSKSGQAKVFDEKADGYVRGEGGAVLLLKPLDRALADDDPIHAVILASGVNHGGRTNSLTVTSPDAQAELILEVMRKAGASPDEVDYIEAHGTGTPLGDPIEIAGLKKAYKTLTNEGKLTVEPNACGIGSVKTNIGHLEGAAGVAGIVKILAALGNESLPANAGFEQLNRLIDLSGTPFRIQSEATPWPQAGKRPRRAAVSSFGFGGSNAHLLIEEAPPRPGRGQPASKRLIFPLSAKTEERLQAQVGALLNFIRHRPPNLDLADLAYTLQMGREAMPLRLAVTASNWRELTEALQAALSGSKQTGRAEDVLAADWLAGNAVDWKGLWTGADKPQRIHAPLYAFARQRHWMDESLGAKDAGPVPHPLLHRNLSTLSTHRFRANLKGGEFFWAEHHVGGRQVLPGVVMLEMARAGLDFAQGETNAGLVLENLVWPRPVRADEEKTALELSLTPKDGGAVAFDIHESDDGSRVFCQGIASRLPASNAGTTDLDALRQSLPNEIAPQACYAKLRASGVAHGPSFQALAEVRRGPGQVLAMLKLGRRLHPTLAQMPLHPVMLDAAIQAWIAMEGDALAGAAVPFACKRVEFHAACEPVMWAHVRPSPTPLANGLRRLDIDLMDKGGKLCVAMHDLSLRVMASEETTAKEEGQAEPALIAAGGWRDAPTVGRRAEPMETMVVLAGLAQALSPQALALPVPRHEDDLGATARNWFSRIHGLIAERLGGKRKQRQQVLVFVPDDLPSVLGEPLAALLRTAAVEQPKFEGAVVRVAGEITKERLARLTEDLRWRSDLFTQLRYDASDQRSAWILGLAPLPPAKAALDPNGVYWITGGQGGLGRLFAPWLKARGAGHVVLSGRRESAGLDVPYVPCDVADLASLREAVARINSEVGPLKGVIHAAGVLNDGFILTRQAVQENSVLVPKIDGTINLDLATKDQPLDFMLLCSSVAGIFGNAGQGGYAVGNAFMDAFAERRNERAAKGERNGKAFAVAWPLWAEGGMSADQASIEAMRRRLGALPMPTASGLDALDRILAAGSQARPIVLFGENEKLVRSVADFGAGTGGGMAEAPASTDASSLKDKALQLVRDVLADVLGLDPSQIRANRKLEEYGLDSIAIVEATNRLEESLGPLSKTLFFEYVDLAGVAGHLAQEHADGLTKRFAVQAAPASQTARAAQPALHKLGGKEDDGANHDIAIVGLSLRVTKAEDQDAFWEMLAKGIDGFQPYPADRWDHGAILHPERDVLGKTVVRTGAFLDRIDAFDPRYFRISQYEAELMSPEVRLFLEASVEAFEDAGYSRETMQTKLGGDVAVIVGTMTNEYDLYGFQNMLMRGSLASGSYTGTIPNMVSYYYGFTGPSYFLDTMCSASSTCVHEAVHMLRAKRCRMALAGGVSLLLHPQKLIATSQEHFTSKTAEAIRGYGLGADGTILGEGVGALVLKRLEDAERDGDHIYGVIKGTAVSNAGIRNGFTVPNPRQQAAAVEQALADAGLDAADIGYIEGHGSGTALGDPIEIKALTQIFAQQGVPAQSCPIGTVKSNVAHLLAASGLAGIAKVLMQMKHGQLAPSLHAETLNPNIPFDSSPFYVQRELTPWKRKKGADGLERPRRAGVTSIGAGGMNSHIVIEEYLDAPRPEETPEPQLLVFSAMNETALSKLVQRFLAHLDRHPEDRLCDLAYSLQTGRNELPCRLAMVVESRRQLADSLLACAARPQAGSGRYFVRSVLNVDPLENGLDEALATGDLETLASAWTSGAAIDWDRLARRNRPRRLSLPAYPFEKVRCWYPQHSDAPSVIHPLGAKQKLHPMIGRNLSDLEGLRYETDIHPGELQDYLFKRQGKAQLLPTLALETIAAAARVAGFEGRLAIENADIQGGFDWSKQRRLAIEIFPDGDALRISLHVMDENENRHLWAEAVVSNEPSIPAHPSIVQDGRRMDKAQIYAALADGGFDFKPFLEVVEEAWMLTNGGVLCRLGENLPQQDGHKSHVQMAAPALGGALQALLLATPERNDADLSFVKRLDLAASGADVRRILVKPCPHGFDAYLLADGGEAIAVIEGLQTAGLRNATGGDLAAATRQDGLCAQLQDIAADLLKFPVEQIGVNEPFQDLGFDSISLTKLADAISTAYGTHVSPAIFFECETIKALADHLGERKGISPKTQTNRPSAKPAQAASSAIARAARRPARDAIAIVGMAGRFPGSPDVETFIDNLLAGRDLTSELPLDRYGPAYADRIARADFPKRGGFLDGIDRFDAAFFRVSPAEALRMDPQQRLMLTTAWRVLEDAGYRPQEMPADTALLIGASNLDYAEMLRVHGVSYDGHAATGNSLAMIANRISHFFNWHGPSETVDTACSSSLVALLRAVEGLRNRRYSAALVGGVNLALCAEGFEGPHLAGMLSPEGRCKSFGADADGYARGEGVVALLLKRLEDAERDGDRIHGLLIAGAENHGGRSGSLTAPSVKAQAELIEAAMAGIDPTSVSYVEAHGTGTALGDPVEANGLKRAFENLMQGKAAKTPFIGLGSVKSNIGHLEAAAGLAGVVKVLMAMRRNILPASLHCEPPNPHMELAASPFALLGENRPWPSGNRPRRAGVSSFGFGGANAHVVLEDYQSQTPPLRRPLPPHPFAETRFWPTQKDTDAEALIMTPVWKSAPSSIGQRFSGQRLVVSSAIEIASGDDFEILKADEAQGPIAQRYAATAKILLERLQAILAAKTQERHLIQLLVPLSGEARLFAGLSGMLETAALESSRIAVQTIEVGGGISAQETRALLDREAGGGLETRVRFLGQERQILTWQEQGGLEETPADLGRVFLIIGGLGGLGRIMAKHFAGTVDKAVLILAGTKPEDDAAAAFIAELQALGAKAAYRQADIANAEQAAKLVADIVGTYGSLDAVFHCAGRLRDGFIARKKDSDLSCVLAPKVMGAQALVDACAGLGVKQLVLFSSMSGVAGNLGQADYAAANGYLDALAEGKGLPVVAIDWPLWQEGGMRIDEATANALFSRMGQRPMTTDQGIRALRKILAARVSRAGVMAGDAGKIRAFFDSLSKPRQEAEEALKTGNDQRLILGLSRQLCRLFETVGGFAEGSIRSDEPLEDYGIDSLMIAKLNAGLKDRFVSLPMTLFFEFRTIEQVARHLAESQPQACRSWTGEEASASPPIPPPTPAAPRRQAERLAPSDDLVAVIGISGHYPMAEDLDAFWDNLANGRDCVTEIPPDRWDMDGFYAPDRDQAVEQGKSYAKWGGFLESFADFDPLFFKISSREAAAIDPQERLFLTASWEACEDAGYAPRRMKQDGSKVGVFAGVTKTGYALHGPFTTEDGATIRPATSFAGVANRVSFAFDLSGPSLAVDTMCSSSLVAIHEACRHLKAGDVDLALAGGVNLYLHPANYIELCAARMLSPDGRCRSFGKNANGFAPGEGVGVLLLKPLSKALADKDRIHAVIRASAVNHGGHANGFTVPNPAAQRDLVQEALSQARLNARDITCVEAHGTGTELGDPIEATALAQAFAADTPDTAFCALGSVKSNIGHLEAAAGVAGLTKLVLQMKHGKLAPTLHADETNPNLCLEGSPFVLQRKVAPWTAHGPRIAGVSSFGAGGVNAHVILEEWPRAKQADSSDDAPQAILLSAKTPEALRRQAARLLAHIERHDIGLADIAYTLQAGREAMEFRLAFEAASPSALKGLLRDWLNGKARPNDIYEGQPGAMGELLALLGGEDELRPMIERWWREKRFDKILPLWVKGLSIDWRDLPRNNRPNIASLPTYAFERQRFWLPDSLATVIAKPNGDTGLALGQQSLDAAIAGVLSGLLQKVRAETVLPFYKPWLEAAHRLLATHPPTTDEDWTGWKALREQGGLAAQIRLAETALGALPEILTGQRQATAVLFPQGSMALVEAVYKENETARRFNASLAKAARAFVGQSTKASLRILEIGAGTGATSEALFEALAPQAGRIGEYCYTDVSQAFLIHAERTYRQRVPQLTTALFDVEKSPEAQSLAIGTYDLVVAANVLHATADIGNTIEHVRGLLAPGGLLLINETSLATLFTHVTFGLLDGWWRFVDPERRIAGTPSLTQESWKNVLEESGLAWLAGSRPAECALGQQIIAAKAPEGAIPVLPNASAAPTLAPPPAMAANGSLRDVLLGLLGETLNLPPASIHLDRPFADYGLDSILGAELTHRIRRTLKVEMDQTKLFDFTTAAQLESFLAEQRPAAALPARPQSKPAPAPTTTDKREPIAIVGMSGRFAGSPDLDALWKHLAAGDDLVGTTTRFDLTPFYRDAPPGSFGDRGSFIDGIENFDASFFGISGLEATYMDPQQRLFLEEAWKTLENAGHAGDDIVGGKVGVFVGCSSGDYQELFKEQPPGQAFWGNTSSLIPSRIAYFLDLKGPAIAIDTACSSSLVAVHMACRSLWNGEAEMALAGGVFAQCGPRFFRYANQAKMLSASGRCAPFGAKADGIVPGEGVAAVLLRPLGAALQDGDTIHGVIVATGVNQDGTTNGITAPSAVSQERLIKNVQQDFAIDPASIGLVEAHGTGTILGDPIEHAALARAFEQLPQASCALGSIKSNIGHATTAAGIAGLVKALLCLGHKAIPPTLHFNGGNPAIRFEDGPFFINTELVPWQAEAGKWRRAAVSSFGFSGTNAHIVVEEPPPAPEAKQDKPGPWLFVLSARNETQLRQLAANMAAHFESRPEADAADVAYTLMAGRRHLHRRLAVTAASLSECAARLRAWLAEAPGHEVATGMLDDLYRPQDSSRAPLDAPLSSLAEHYVKGLRLDAESLFGAKRKRVPLPAYPFAPTRYWVEAAATPTPTPSVANAAPAVRLADPALLATSFAATPIKPPAKLAALAQPPATSCGETKDGVCRIVATGGWSAAFENDVRQASQDSDVRAVVIVGQKDMDGKTLPECAVPVVSTLSLGNCDFKAADESQAMVMAQRIAQAPRLALTELKKHMFGPNRLPQTGTSDLELLLSPATPPALQDGMHSMPLPLATSCLQASLFDDGVVLVRLIEHRFTDAFMDGIGETFQMIGKLAQAKAVVLTGEGGFFASGGTQEGLESLQRGETRFTDRKIYSLPLDCPLPVIAAMQGHAIGAGWSLGMFCDAALFAAEAVYHSNYLRIGFTPGAGATLVFPHRLGDALGREVLFTAHEYRGRDLSARKPDLGVLPAAQVLPAALALAHGLACETIDRLKTLKAQARKPLAERLTETFAQELAMHEKTFIGSKTVKERLEKLFPTKETTPSPKPAPLQSSGKPVRQIVIASLAEDLMISQDEIRDGANFLELGLDSILAVTWIRRLNGLLGVELPATAVYAHPSVGALIAHLEKMTPAQVEEEVAAAPAQTAANPDKTNAIAIIGVSGRFPKARDIEAFWNNIREGLDCIEEVPPDRWDVKRFYHPDPLHPGTSYCRWMGAIDEIDRFDAGFFNITPREAELMDPQQRLFLEHAWHAFEDAGLAPETLAASRCGIFIGAGPSGYEKLIDEHNAYSLLGRSGSILAARIAHLLDLQGPCISLDTACSSSLVAIAQACNSLLIGDSDLALAGGVSVMIGPEMFIDTSKVSMLSKDGRCFAFDQRANGFVPGEGVGILLLKRLEDARRDKDPIHAIIRGWGVNQDGRTNGITAPNPQAQTRLIKSVHERFGIKPSSIGLIEAHGTGTPLGDPIEIEGLTDAFAGSDALPASCALGSVKSNIGHLLAAAGVAGAIKAMLAVERRELPPTIQFEKLNEHINLKGTPFVVNDRRRDWKADGSHPRRVGVSAFGFSGTNAHLVIEEHLPVASKREAGPWLFTLSARTPERLGEYGAIMERFVAAHHDIGLADLAHTLQTGRKAMRCRLAFVFDSRESLLRGLASVVAGRPLAFIHMTDRDGQANESRLDRLAQEWVKGSEIDWKSVSQGQRIHLPGYPFARDRHWVAEKSPLGEIAQNKDSQPLLDSLAAPRRISLSLRGDEPHLTSHATGSERMLLGLFLLELAREAAERAGGKPVHGLKHLLWGTPVRINGRACELTLTLDKDDDGFFYQVAADGQGASPCHVGEVWQEEEMATKPCPPWPNGQDLTSAFNRFADALAAHSGAPAPECARIVDVVMGEDCLQARLLRQKSDADMAFDPLVLDAVWRLSAFYQQGGSDGAAPLPFPRSMKTAWAKKTTSRKLNVHIGKNEKGRGLAVAVFDDKGAMLMNLEEVRLAQPSDLSEIRIEEECMA